MAHQELQLTCINISREWNARQKWSLQAGGSHNYRCHCDGSIAKGNYTSYLQCTRLFHLAPAFIVMYLNLSVPCLSAAAHAAIVMLTTCIHKGRHVFMVLYLKILQGACDWLRFHSYADRAIAGGCEARDAWDPVHMLAWITKTRTHCCSFALLQA